MRFSLLGSGSSGNAMLIVAGSTRILVDCGLSFRQLTLRAEALGETLDGLSAVFITHEHGDHVAGLGVLSRKLKVPIYLSPGTAEYLPKSLGRVDRLRPMEAGDSVRVGDIRVESFSVTHDAADPVSYVVHNGQSRLGIELLSRDVAEEFLSGIDPATDRERTRPSFESGDVLLVGRPAARRIAARGGGSREPGKQHGGARAFLGPGRVEVPFGGAVRFRAGPAHAALRFGSGAGVGAAGQLTGARGRRAGASRSQS